MLKVIWEAFNKPRYEQTPVDGIIMFATVMFVAVVCITVWAVWSVNVVPFLQAQKAKKAGKKQ